MLHRRGLITGLISLVAMPAIVRIESIMAVKALPPSLIYAVTPNGALLYDELRAISRRAFLPKWQTDLYLNSPILRCMVLDTQA